MPRYRIADQTIKRKHFYLPCALDARWDDLAPEEQARLLKATYWADYITEAEWPVVLDHEAATKSNRSRLKRKGAGWLMALGRIAVLNPELFASMLEQARTMYADQVGQEWPWMEVCDLLLPEVDTDDEPAA